MLGIAVNDNVWQFRCVAGQNALWVWPTRSAAFVVTVLILFSLQQQQQQQKWRFVNLKNIEGETITSKAWM